MAGESVQPEIINSEGSSGAPIHPEATNKPGDQPGTGDQLQKIEELRLTTELLKSTWETMSSDIKEIREKSLSDQERELSEIREEIKKLKDDMGDVKDTERRSIEVIGVISAIIALVLAFINTADKQLSLQNSFFILTTIFFSFIFFAGLIHEFFTKNKKTSLYYVCFFILPIIAILITGLFIAFWDR